MEIHVYFLDNFKNNFTENFVYNTSNDTSLYFFENFYTQGYKNCGTADKSL